MDWNWLKIILIKNQRIKLEKNKETATHFQENGHYYLQSYGQNSIII